VDKLINPTGFFQSMRLSLYIVDVFAEAKYEGNQLAVVVDNIGLSQDLMQKIAREMHFSETTFITSSDLEKKSFRVRIFTPEGELPFAGHPTLGTAYIAQKILLKKKVPDITLNMEVGPIKVSFNYEGEEPGVLWMRQLPPEFGETHSVKAFEDFLGLRSEDFDEKYPIQEVSTGVYFYIIPLKTKAALKKVKVNFEKLSMYSQDKKAKWPFMFCRETENPENQIKARMITTFTEDPATGSANGCLAGYLLKHGYFCESELDVKVEQGAEVKRPSVLYLKSERKGNDIIVEVGGKVAYIAEGYLV